MKYLNPVDAAFLRLDSLRTPMNISVLLSFELPADAGPGWLQALFAAMRAAPVTAAPFAEQLATGPLARLAPAWVPATGLDIDYHLRHSCLPYPGGERELGVLVARLHSNPLDLRRPPWECHLIEGLERGRFAIYLKLHHAAMDGLRALAMLQRWLSTTAEADTPAAPWALPPADEDTAGAAGGMPASTPASAMHQLREHLRAAAELSRQLARMARPRDNPDGGIYSALATPRTIFNQPITQQRRLATQLFALDRVKAISRASGATVNDIALALCGAAMRRYLIELDALPAATLVASVPVGLPRADGRPGNAVVGFVVPLATDQDDPLERLRIIRSVTTRTKEQLRTLSATAQQQMTLLGLSPMLLGQMSGLSRQLPPLFNVIVSNVLGSRSALYLRGARLESMYPVSVLFDAYALNITVVGYADRIGFGITGCRDALPRLQRLAVYTGEALTELETALGLGAAARTPRRRRRAAAQS